LDAEEEPSPRWRSPRSVLKPIDLFDAIRLTGGIGASAWTHSPWWLLAAMAYNIAGEPARAFLQAVGRRVGPALGDVWADRIRRHGRSSDSP
jgi:hypothetical protein